ncbi:NAD-dependent epimerase/dehydratase family protein [Candidatus Peribacteria bacterium]|nr:NAD-dependent epimerase/dehydratase family protein [Candidatus Peribacteria bacterium]
MSQKILLTGGSGLIGTSIAEHLRSRGVEVLAPSHADGDLRNPDFCKKIIVGVDRVFHLASFRKNVAYHLAHRKEVMEANIGMTDVLSKALLEQGKPIPVTFFSTAILGAYPENLGAGIHACQAGKYARSPSIDDIADGYAAAKLRCEQHWREVCAEMKSPLLIVRPSSAYGPGDNFGPEANVIPSLIKKCREGQGSFTVWGSGKQMRSFLYAPDVGPALMTLIEKNVTGVEYLCPPERVSIRQLAEMIRGLVKPEMGIEFDTSQPEGPSFPVLPMHSALKGMPWTPLADGLKATVNAMSS